MYQLSFAVTTCLKTESVKLATIHLACNSVNRLGGLFILAGFAGLSFVHVSSQLANMLGWLVYDGLAWDNRDLYILVASYPPASLKLTTWWQGFSEQQERINSSTQASFKPLLVSRLLTSPWLKQVTWPSLASLRGTQSYIAKGHGYKERESLWPRLYSTE